MRARKLTLAALAVAAGLSLAACQSGTDTKGQSAPSSAPTASAPDSGSGSGNADQSGANESAGTDSAGTASGSGSGTGSGSGSGTGSGSGSGGSNGAGSGSSGGTASNANSGVGRCHTGELEITAQDGTIDGDPDGTVVVELKNRSDQDCVIAGYAGVDLETSAGALSAQRTGQETTSSVLKSGKSTYFPVEYPFNTSGGSGVRITGLVVTPPNETTSVTLSWPGAATLPVTDGSGSPVKVGPVGSAGQGGE
ncbi:DUF4232 domain-containing protein [Actinacidiphila yeochonensis]|uniref:DUF4232 domain-containing protein n=1 Tax=Actinacidiphila yeochonensis TaxID=89050 RepID=UPI00056B1416|nr:DUF4232 domain-containing protein [Actinacidiphila yeochonensis]